MCDYGAEPFTLFRVSAETPVRARAYFMKEKNQSRNIQWRCAVATVRMDGSVYNNSVWVRAETSVRAKK